MWCKTFWLPKKSNTAAATTTTRADLITTLPTSDTNDEYDYLDYSSGTKMFATRVALQSYKR